MPTSRDESSGSECDEFPDLDTLVHRTKHGRSTTGKPPTKATSVRRRKLVPPANNVLLKPWAHETPSLSSPDTAIVAASLPEQTKRAKVHVRARNHVSTARLTTINVGREDRGSHIIKEAAYCEEATADDSSDFQVAQGIDSDDSEGSGDPSDRSPSGLRPSFLQCPRPSAPSEPRITRPRKTTTARKVERHATKDDAGRPQYLEGKTCPRVSRAAIPDADLASAFDGLCTNDLSPATKIRDRESRSGRSTTPPPSTSPKLPTGLTSPKKLSRIPATPHHPSTDLFWSREFVDDWNDEHSPKKQLFADALKTRSGRSVGPRKKGMASGTAAVREAKKAFEEAKHRIAKGFLEELDQAITHGRLSELAEATGGIKVNWTNKLNTTAGRANWKRETVRTKNPDGTETSVNHRHHASIELAEKVIDNEHRLLNVIAHEFCHLANFMVTGITNNPHGKEFKAWAAKCSHMFGSRGIEVTTKHSYDIDFRYVWECTSCTLQYKRHSKSINPDRHRCGSCKSQLKQTRPVPRAGTGEPSEYQKFMKEQMRLLRQEDPKSPQKDIMKRVADRWSSLPAASKASGKTGKVTVSIDEVAVGIDDMDLNGAGHESVVDG